jgi:hypothetical protein
MIKLTHTFVVLGLLALNVMLAYKSSVTKLIQPHLSMTKKKVFNYKK